MKSIKLISLLLLLIFVGCSTPQDVSEDLPIVDDSNNLPSEEVIEEETDQPVDEEIENPIEEEVEDDVLESDFLPIDTKTLRHDADFEIKISEGVYWVPANVLGGTRLTNEEMLENIGDYLWLRENINTLYELLQYIQVVGFRTAMISTNRHIIENGKAWEHFQPAELVIANNAGNCAGNVNFVRYVLEGKYDEVGQIVWHWDLGGGHFMPYIKHEGYYYVFDVGHYSMNFNHVAVESGKLESYYNSDYIANIHRVSDLSVYAEFYRNAILRAGNKAPTIFAKITSDIVPIGYDRTFTEDSDNFLFFPSVIEPYFTVIYRYTNALMHYEILEDGPLLWPEAWDPYYDRWWLEDETED